MWLDLGSNCWCSTSDHSERVVEVPEHPSDNNGYPDRWLLQQELSGDLEEIVDGE